MYPRLLISPVDLYGKVAIITGANTGIGYEVARALAGSGARVVMACRNAHKGKIARDKIIEDTGNDKVELEILDCASFASVKEFLNRWEKRELAKVDILINNAGKWNYFYGFEQTYQVNHLAHVLLTHMLLNRNHFASNARIVSVSSVGLYMCTPMDERNTDASDTILKHPAGSQLPFVTMVHMYSRTKAAQAIWSMILQRRLNQTEEWKNIIVQSCHPGEFLGLVKSLVWSQPAGIGSVNDWLADIGKQLINLFGISSEQGALVPVWLATAEEPARMEMRGLYWDRLKWKWVPAWILEKDRQEMLWEKWCADAGASLL
ncbi:NAD(P)-binding protein [Ceratobasidium sp. AG-I]|nr:NAD(P)-binding protein [Ceratobasidium sp. AG-I]